MISYKPLMHLLIDHDLGKREFVQKVGIGQATFDRMVAGRHISTETLERICTFFDCPVEQVIKIIPNKRPDEK